MAKPFYKACRVAKFVHRKSGAETWLYLDKNSGHFIAAPNYTEPDDTRIARIDAREIVRADTLAALKVLVDEVLANKYTVVWRRVLVVKPSSRSSTKHVRGDQLSSVWEDGRAASNRLELDFDRHWIGVSETGKTFARRWFDEDDPRALEAPISAQEPWLEGYLVLEYTPARWRALCAIRRSIADTGRELEELLAAGDDLVELLDEGELAPPLVELVWVEPAMLVETDGGEIEELAELEEKLPPWGVHNEEEARKIRDGESNDDD